MSELEHRTENQSFSCVDEALSYMRSQIDPHDRLNPKYAYLHAAIESIVKAKADILARQAPALVLKHAEISREGDTADFFIMKYAQRNPRVCCSNYATGEPILFGGRFQR